MKKHFISTSAQWLCVLLCLFCLLGITACATTRGAADTSSIVGTWAYDYGYNQELWADDLMTFNIDGTFDSHLVAPYYSEWDKGTWSLSTDAQGRQVLALHTTAYSNDNNTWNNVDITSYYYTDVLDDELVMNRFKRDRVQEDGWHPVEYYEPAIYNHWYRVKNGTKGQLIQDSWTVDKLRTQGCDWDETWTFNADGTMTSDWSDNGTEILTGTYDLKEKDGKTILHQQLSFNDGTTGEWWYEYSSCGPDLIRVALINSSSGGELDEPYVNYYYRDVPLVKYTYHWKVNEKTTYTFYDYWPKGRDYTLPDVNRPYLFTNVPEEILNQTILGWYTDESLSGEAVSSISAKGNTKDREFWVDWGLRCKKNVWDDGNYNYQSLFPSTAFAPDMKLPASGDVITAKVTGKMNAVYSGDFWFTMEDWSENGAGTFYDESTFVQTDENGCFTAYYTFTVRPGVNIKDLNNLMMRVSYGPYQRDDELLISDASITIFDASNAKDTITVTYNYGESQYIEKYLKGEQITLPDSLETMGQIYWDYQSTDIVSWYDNASLTGSPVTATTASRDCEYWAEWNMQGEQHDGYCNTSFPAKALFPDLSFNGGETITILFEADLSKDINGWSQIKFWGPYGMLACGETQVNTNGKKLYAVYNVETNSKSPKENEWFSFDFVYNQESGPVVFSNWKLVILDDSNSYKVDYHFGDLTYTELAYTGSDRTLPEDLMYFVNLNWQLAQQEVESWYENPSFTGTPVATIPSGNRTDKSYYAKINLKSWKSEWIDNGKPVHDYNTAVPVKVLAPGNSFNPKPQDTVSVYFSATLSHDLDGYAGLKLQGDNFFEQDYPYIKTENKKLSRIFNIKINSNTGIPPVDNLFFDFGYSSDACDEFITFSDIEFVILDDSNSYNINYHIGNQVYTEKALSGVVKNLPTTMSYFGDFLQKPDFNLDWNLTFGGYTDNDGSLPASIAAGESKDVYLKILPRMHDGDAFFYSHLLGNVVLSESDINDLAGSTAPVTFRLTAKTAPTPSGQGSTLTITNYEHEEWDIQASANGTGFTTNADGSWSLTFNLAFADNVTQIQSNPDNILVSFDYNSEFYDGEITFTDFKLELVTD
ncbi:MAG: hypothetical protein KBT02_11755 [Treponema sp.]|nr:hypothetical protein [Candidatus Treponema caballi]